MMPKIIILTKQSLIKKDCFLRLIFNIYQLKKLGQKGNILIADTSYSVGHFLIKIIAWLYNIEYLYIPSRNLYYSPSEIKNNAAKYVFEQKQSEYLFFLDVDVLMNCSALDYLSKLIKNRVAFYWFPIKFTDKTQNNISMWRYSQHKQEIVIDEKHILQAGFVTGAQLIRKDLFEKLGGYNEKLKGYGGEDIEFIHRATGFLAMRPHFSATSCYFIDDRGYNASSLIGFRNFYRSLYSRHFEEIYLYHFWHKRKNKSGYLKNRHKNDQLMLKLMKETA